MTKKKKIAPARLGIDIGSSNLHAHAVLPDGKSMSWVAPLRGKPLETLAALARDRIARFVGEDSPVALGVTGQGRSLLSGAVPHEPINEVVAVTAGARSLFPKVRTVVEFGGQLAKWILLDDDGHIADFSTNGLCAAGSGAFLEQQASRLGLSVREFSEVAAKAEGGATVAGRCSVFAKSDMIHLQQKGTPLPQIAYGVCQALIRTYASTVMAGRKLEGPVVLAGGGAANQGLVRALEEATRGEGIEFLVPRSPLTVSALGAALLAGDLTNADVDAIRDMDTDRMRGERFEQATTLPPLPEIAPRPLEEDRIPGAGPVRAFLGVDVGSVSTNLVLLDGDLEFLAGIYLKTAGLPVDAIERGLARIRELTGDRLEILGTGTTGSGRHLAARLLGADVVRNEITAQMVSTHHYVPDADTVFEIGGQDSKYIGLRDGHLSSFEMNKICAAGTGSFLEEQAEGLGISIFGEFAARAFEAKRPRDLGTRCTVFMDTEMRKAQQEGAGLEDICAGLAYSVARNYLDKVVAGRRVGRKIVFQGGTASNSAVVAAMSSVLGRPIDVHPYNRVSGAIGMALIAAREKGIAYTAPAFAGLDACAKVHVSSFECKACENRCQVSRINGRGKRVHFGDVCEKFSGKDSSTRGRDRPFEELFEAREALMNASVESAREGKQRPELGILRASVGLELAPFLAHLASGLGYRPVLSRPTDTRTIERGASGLPAEICLPIKVASGHLRSLLAEDPMRPILAPSITDLAAEKVGEESVTCYLTQEWPFIHEDGRRDNVWRPQFGLGKGNKGLVEAAASIRDQTGAPLHRITAALWSGIRAQKRFAGDLKDLGRKAIEADFDRAVVVIGRPYNLYDSHCNLNLARHLDKVGLPAIPVDMLPLPQEELDERWSSVPWKFGRQAIRAIELMREDPRLFPVVVSSFGCGVDGFVFKHLEEMLADRPRLLLEFDEHRGEAGLITRLEAFADEIEDHLGLDEKAAEPRVTPGVKLEKDSRRVFLPFLEGYSNVLAGAFRAAGYEAVVMPAPDAASVARGEAHSSGRECHPYSIVAGHVVDFLEDDDVGEDDMFISPGAITPCLLRQYGDGYRIIQERMGKPGPRVVDLPTGDLGFFFGLDGVLHFYEGMTAAEFLMPLARRVRPYADYPDAPMERLDAACQEIESALAGSRPIKPILARAAGEIWSMATRGKPGDRPIVGVTGDLYTRFVQAGNANLFDRLERLGMEVWHSPFFAASGSFSDSHDRARDLVRGDLDIAAYRKLTGTTTSILYNAMARVLPPEIRPLVVEPEPEALRSLARPYSGPVSNWLYLQIVSKLIDFMNRGASGALSVAGVNCMIGTAVAGAIPAIRSDHGGFPMVALAYGGSEGPGQKIKLETFAHQVARRRAVG